MLPLFNILNSLTVYRRIDSAEKHCEGGGLLAIGTNTTTVDSHQPSDTNDFQSCLSSIGLDSHRQFNTSANMEQPPESISSDQLQALIGSAKQIGVQPVNGQTYKQEVEKLLENVDALQRTMDSYIPSGVLPHRWEYFTRARRQLKMTARLLRKSIST